MIVIERAGSAAVRTVRARTVSVPLDPPIATAGGDVSAAPLVLIDLETDAGITGRSYLFCYTPLALQPTADLVRNFGASIVGDAVAPLEIERKLQSRVRLIGPQGLVGMALAGIDMAAWDAAAQAAGLPLAEMLGGQQRPIPAYGSLRAVSPEGIARETAGFRAAGARAFKIKIGLGDIDADLRQVAALREAAGPGAALMVDYNQSLSVVEAIRRGRVLDAQGLDWIEEPTTFNDDDGHAAIARELRTPVQIGENWWGVPDMTKSIAAHASDLVMLDAMKIGGVSGWLRAAALADAHGLAVSSHLYCELSTHLLAVTPRSQYVEFLDIAGPILAQPLHISNGAVLLPRVPGVGISWNEEAVARYAVDR